MENQTRFDLNAAIENWRNELAAQPNLACDDRRELEIHLRDTMAELRQHGLNDEEAFWLARRRVGKPQQLGEEFVKADPAKVWRERVLWICLAFFLLIFWADIIGSLDRVMMPVRVGSIVNLLDLPLVLTLLSFVIPLIVAVLLASGKMIQPFSKLSQLFQSRRLFAVTALVLIATSSAISVGASIVHNARIHYPAARKLLSVPVWQELYTDYAFKLIIALLIIWIIPRRTQRALKHA
jgi:hypothetical protein